jgi:hydrophobe/amphiphile efflux-1 (HAE1) family protein
MTLSDISIKRPVFAWMLMIGLILFGVLSLRGMGVSQLPDVDFPVVNVQVTYEGAAPEVMELDVIDPIESAILSVEGVKSINSSARLGSANISVEFNLDKDINVAVSEIESRINQANRFLPQEIEAPIISKVNPDDRPIMWLSVSSESMSPKDLMAFVRDNLKDKFQTVSGVADVFLGGYVEPNLRVWVSNEKMNQKELTVVDLISAIQSEHKESPSGLIEDAKFEKNVRTLGEATSVDEFTNLPIIRRGGAPNFVPVSLGEMVKVEEGLADVRRISRVQGKTAVGLGIRKQRGSNAVSVAEAVKTKMEKLRSTLPKGMELGVNFDSTQFIGDSIHELSFTMILSAILTAIVCWLFLGSITSTINVILAIPTSILGAFMILRYMNFTLNTFTLLGLSLSIGIVVDDAIMVLENIYRHFEEGKNKVLASLEGANEISFAALAATVAIMAIFLPVAFMEGIIGKYFFQFGVTISVAVGLSYIEALTLTPMRTSQFMESSTRVTKVGKLMDSLFDRGVNFYKNILKVVLTYRWTTVLLSFLFFGSTFFLIKKIPKEFVPTQDTSSFLMRVKTPDGSSLIFTDHVVKEVENYLMQRKEVKRTFVAIGGFGGNESNSANLFVTLVAPEERKLNQQDFLEELRNYFKDFKTAKVFIQDTSQGGFSASGRGFPVEFTLTGGDWAQLIDVSKKTMEEMKKTGLYSDIDTSYKESVSEIQIFPDREKAKLRGVSVRDIGVTINSMIGGVVVGKFSKNGHRNDIRIKMSDSSKNKQEDLKNIFVRNNRGELIRLVDVVKIKELPGVQTISRLNRGRAISIFSGVSKGKSQEEALKKVKEITLGLLPPGYELVESGASETFSQTFKSLIFALILGLVIAYMILAAQFNSFLDPVTVLIALPFSFSGAFLALWLTGLSLNIYSAIGLILLMGIVKKNSILLVDFTNKYRQEGHTVQNSLFEACPKRIRPIMMTTFSTVAGAIPLALSLGPGSETLRPMAMAIIGGSLVSTFLTLLVVPAFYSLMTKNNKVL